MYVKTTPLFPTPSLPTLPTLPPTGYKIWTKIPEHNTDNSDRNNEVNGWFNPRLAKRLF